MPRSTRIESFPRAYYSLVETVIEKRELIVETIEPFVLRGRYFAFLSALRKECERGDPTERIREIRMLAEQIAIRVKKGKLITFYMKSDDPITKSIEEAIQTADNQEEAEFSSDDEAKSAQKLLESLK